MSTEKQKMEESVKKIKHKENVTFQKKKNKEKAIAQTKTHEKKMIVVFKLFILFVRLNCIRKKSNGVIKGIAYYKQMR